TSIGTAYNVETSGDAVANWKRMMDDVRVAGHLYEMQNGRYAPVNTHALSAHGTLEFRSHGGTTEFAKIQAWIVLTPSVLTRTKEKGCQARARMTGRWAEKVMFFWKAIDWYNLEDAQVILAKNTLNARFKHFKDQENPARVTERLQTIDEDGRIRSTNAAS